MTRRGPMPVRAWLEPVVIPTYPTMPPDRNPMFLEKRVYQGSSGRVYPNRFTDRVADERVDRTWQAVHLENDYVRLMILPEIGGRIHVGQDKTNGYDFFYRQHVIKPALVGLLGPWISGGVEFNWPQHHRPSTFMPVDWMIEEELDGGRTVWLSEHEPMDRMKGMVGIRLRPGSSLIEARVRLANRTPHVQTFLWWANVAVRVHDQYQSFFPPDVTYVADHARRAMSRFPIARGHYYGIDYGARPEAAADLSWYANIPVPTSYMAMDSEQDFFGGYDHEAEAGLVHIADHRIAPGKKQWTWGNAAFGRAWERNLTDEDGPYVELMAGVYTDNQPDFSFLAPYETRTFEQYWYPIRQIGPAVAANRDAAVSLRLDGRRVRIGVAATSPIPGARVRLDGPAGVILERTLDIAPEAPFVTEIELAGHPSATDLSIALEAADGRPILTYRPAPGVDRPVPASATEPLPPAAIGTVEELLLTGRHLEQYRHATRLPEPYWREALRRDPGDTRSNTALGVRLLRAGDLRGAEHHLRRAIARLTQRNPNPYDGEPHYQLGLCLRLQGRLDEAEDAFAKAAWNRAWQGPAYYALAQLRGRAGDLRGALRRVEQALEAEPRHACAPGLRAALLRRTGDLGAARAVVDGALAIDPLDRWALEEGRRVAAELPATRGAEAAQDRGPAGRPVLRPQDAQTALDLAHDYAGAGLLPEAIEVLEAHRLEAGPHGLSNPLVHYTIGWLTERSGDSAGAIAHYERGGRMPADGCFPARLEEIEILLAVQAAVPHDARAPYYLGNLYYDRRRYREAIAAWERARTLDASFATVHRNLGIAEANVRRRPAAARRSYLRAFAADPTDGRVLYELDQLLKRQNAEPSRRLSRLEAHRDLVDERDDLGVEYATLLAQLDRPGDALAYLSGRRFHPWEGGEGRALGAYTAARLRLGRAALEESSAPAAVVHFEAALDPPESLGEARHPLMPEHEIRYELGSALAAAGDRSGAIGQWALAAKPLPDGSVLAPASYFRGMAFRALGRESEARSVFEALHRSARRQARRTVEIDYFATSLASFLLFEDDLDLRNRITCRHLEGLALLGLGRRRGARRAFRDVLELDIDHQEARIALAWSEIPG